MIMQRTNLYLGKRQKERLQALADETGIPLSEHVRRAIDRYLEDEAPNQRKRR